MKRRYELTDQEWAQIANLFPKENTGRPSKENRNMLNAMIWIACSGAPWRDLPERYGPWETVYSRFRKVAKKGAPPNEDATRKALYLRVTELYILDNLRNLLLIIGNAQIKF